MAFNAELAGASATSYLEVAEADALAREDVGRNARAWLQATIDAKEAALITATRMIDGWRPWGGSRFYETQLLVFPRSWHVLADGATPYLEPNVRQAAYEQAVYLLANADLLDDAAAMHARNLSSFQSDDGSGSVSVSPTRNLIAPEAEVFLRSIAPTNRLRHGRTLRSVPMRGSTYDPPVLS